VSVVPTSKLIPLPVDLSFEQGAAFPLQGMTAPYLIHEYRVPKPGDTVPIHAAAGGMGLLLTQWARHRGDAVERARTEEPMKTLDVIKRANGIRRRDIQWERKPLAPGVLTAKEIGVIGGTNGIGRALARLFAAKGAEVVVDRSHLPRPGC
jgi:NADPH:quinone reductase-like Zn-dependent oxidoreductase